MVPATDAQQPKPSSEQAPAPSHTKPDRLEGLVETLLASAIYVKHKGEILPITADQAQEVNFALGSALYQTPAIDRKWDRDPTLPGLDLLDRIILAVKTRVIAGDANLTLETAAMLGDEVCYRAHITGKKSKLGKLQLRLRVHKWIITINYTKAEQGTVHDFDDLNISRGI